MSLVHSIPRTSLFPCGRLALAVEGLEEPGGKGGTAITSFFKAAKKQFSESTKATLLTNTTSEIPVHVYPNAVAQGQQQVAVHHNCMDLSSSATNKRIADAIDGGLDGGNPVSSQEALPGSNAATSNVSAECRGGMIAGGTFINEKAGMAKMVRALFCWIRPEINTGDQSTLTCLKSRCFRTKHWWQRLSMNCLKALHFTQMSNEKQHERMHELLRLLISCKCL